MKIDKNRMYFRIEVGKGIKGRYNTRFGSFYLHGALRWYAGINIGNNYKKRLTVTKNGVRIILITEAS